MVESIKNFENEELIIDISQELKDNLIKEAERKNISLSDLISEILENI